MYQVIIVIHVLLGLGVIGLVLMQQGKGADAGAAFGTGSAGSVFGAQGAASFLSRSTAILATLFFATSLGLAIANGHKDTEKDIMSTPASEQGNSDIPNIQGTKTDIPPPVATPAIPTAPLTAPPITTPEAAQNSATPKPAEQTTTPAVEEKPQAIAEGKKANETKEETKPTVETKKPATAATTEKKTKTDTKKSVEKSSSKDKKATTAKKETKKDY